ncbi:MAG: hypothetical protein GXY80_09935 [Syntrophorhabdus aromaticivorans]|jgi:hypothetical protein|uniref:Uncharacterized protein n=1 Tax=Syntrophorhabdus aromaticivorans TaxID=328301 RepID=A0A971M4M6_9BACT|nr:hypothetical protein [Syntrophorhabdus aromaticivorans]
MFLKIVTGLSLLLLVASAHTQESMRFDSEAKKLAFIRQMLLQAREVTLSEDSRQHCHQMMKDLLAGKDIKAIEPDVRADSASDPRLARWNQCLHHVHKDLSDEEERKIYWSLRHLGDPPYRYYRVELDGNAKDGPEDLIYHETPKENAGSASTGYTWVDLKNCMIRGGFVSTGFLTKRSSKRNAVYLNTLLRYKGQLWAADFVEGFGFNLSRWIDRHRMEVCQWWLSAN